LLLPSPNTRVNYGKRHRTVLVYGSLFTIALMLVSPIESYLLTQKAYADGLSVENLPPASVGNRQLSLYLKVNPPILTTTNGKSAYMQFRLFDAVTNQTIQHVTYLITVTRGTGSSTTQRPLLVDFFHAHNGLLTLHVEPQPGTLTVYGQQDPFLQSWVADPGGNILIRGPLLLQGGLYHFHVEIFTIDNDRTLFVPQQAPKFDAYLSVGSVYDMNELYQNHKYNTTLISYYNQLNNLKYDPSRPMFTWSMPFDYNITRIKAQPIFVHEEMRLPKAWKGFGDLTQFNATVNGMPLSGRSLAIDPFSFPNDTVVHYLVNKNDIIRIANAFNANHTNTKSTTSAAANTSHSETASSFDPPSKSVNTTAAMNFALTPFTGVARVSTSSDIPTNTGSIHAALSWSPNPLIPNTASKVNITFYDPTGTAPLTGMNVKYNLIIYNQNNQPIITKNNLIAKGATDTQSITFPAAQTYHMQVQITQLVKPGQTPDLTRNGVATGYVVVPEFPSYLTVSLVMAAMIGAVVFMQSRKKLFYARDTS
jgi:hypothetical protein